MMTAGNRFRVCFRRVMAERRKHRPGSINHEYLTRAARKYVWLMRSVPTTRWDNG